MMPQTAHNTKLKPTLPLAPANTSTCETNIPDLTMECHTPTKAYFLLQIESFLDIVSLFLVIAVAFAKTWQFWSI